MNIFICLIGSNPLPNFVVCSYLRSKERDDIEILPIPQKFIFVHSVETKLFKDQIAKLLKLDSSSLFSISLNDERDWIEIIDRITSTLERVSQQSKIKSIHINFTGGTKPMAVFNYNTVNDFAKNRVIDFISSDISPKDYKLQVIKNHEECPRCPLKGDLRDVINISLKDILELHNMSIGSTKKLGSTEPTYSINLENIKNDVCNDKIKQTQNMKGQSDFYNATTAARGFKEVIQRDKNYSPPKNKITEYYNNISNHLISYEFLEPGEKNLDEFKKLIGFVDGTWLEDYILECIKEVKGDYKLDDIRRSIEPNYKNRKCEIDVVARRGYQLFLFSCTTAKEIKEVKLKAFEVMYRASQLGGGHTKAVMIHMLPNYESKQLELDLSSFDAQQNITTIGLDELIDNDKLQDKLKEVLDN